MRENLKMSRRRREAGGEGGMESGREGRKERRRAEMRRRKDDLKNMLQENIIGK